MIRAVALLAVMAVSCAAAPPRVMAAESVEDLLRGAWYDIEFFVFERSEVLDASVREVLSQAQPLAYPHAMGVYRTPGEAFGAAYELDAATRACLTFPTLSYTTSPLLAEAGLDASDAASPATDTGLDEKAAATADLAGEPLPAPTISPRLEANPLVDLLNAVAEFERTLEATRGQWQPEESFQLRREARLVERRRVGRVLFHGRWRQALPARDAAEPILLQAGERLPEGFELTGTVNVTLGRYLHFQALLNYTAPLLGLQPRELALRADGSVLALAAPAPAQTFMRMAESRRMRSEELHYLDHPKLGIVVRIDPVPVPEELNALFEALQENVK